MSPLPTSSWVCVAGKSRPEHRLAQSVWYTFYYRLILGGMLTGFDQAKLNQILRIEEELGDKAVFVGNHFRNAVNM